MSNLPFHSSLLRQGADIFKKEVQEASDKFDDERFETFEVYLKAITEANSEIFDEEDSQFLETIAEDESEPVLNRFNVLWILAFFQWTTRRSRQFGQLPCKHD